MGGNFIENPILHDAILELQRQYDLGYTGDISRIHVTLILTSEGRLTVASHIKIRNGRKVPIPDPSYTPVSCYDQIPDGLDLKSAVEWYLNERNSEL